MAIATLTEVDTRIRDLVIRELEWDAAVDASAIGVAAKDRMVTLTGYADTYLCKLAAERAAKRVRGVRAVANDIEVRLKIGRTDADIARDVVRALELRSTVPDNVQATVHHDDDGSRICRTRRFTNGAASDSTRTAPLAGTRGTTLAT